MKNKKAFTLVELLVVIAVIAILFIVILSKVNFATDKAKDAGVLTDFRSYQIGINNTMREVGHKYERIDASMEVELSKDMNKNLDKKLGFIYNEDAGEYWSVADNPYGYKYVLKIGDGTIKVVSIQQQGEKQLDVIANTSVYADEGGMQTYSKGKYLKWGSDDVGAGTRTNDINVIEFEDEGDTFVKPQQTTYDVLVTTQSLEAGYAGGTASASKSKASDNSTVTLTAVADDGFKLARWENSLGIVGTEESINIVVSKNSDNSYTAVFELDAESPLVSAWGVYSVTRVNSDTMKVLHGVPITTTSTWTYGRTFSTQYGSSTIDSIIGNNDYAYWYYVNDKYVANQMPLEVGMEIQSVRSPQSIYRHDSTKMATNIYYGNSKANLWGLGGLYNVVQYTSKSGQNAGVQFKGTCWVIGYAKVDAKGARQSTVYSLNSDKYPANGKQGTSWYTKIK